jgi:glycosyltransferase involved in cell wall biosynthesis
MKQKRLLLFAYFYPPLGGPAVQRPLKMIKYLYNMGWITDVISVKDIVYHSRDESLVQEDKAAGVYRTGSADVMSILKKTADKTSLNAGKVYFHTPEFLKRIIRSSFLIDDKYGWLKYAVKQAEALCRKHQYSAVMATISPFTPALAAYQISQKFALPLIIDYRDHWTLNPFHYYFTPIHKMISTYWEKKVVQQASLISTAGSFLGEDLVRKFGKQQAVKLQIMYNGWDKEDFAKLQSTSAPTGKFIISYLGSLYGKQTVKYFIQAVQNMRKKRLLPDNLEIRFIGNFYRENLALLRSQELSDIIKIIPQVEHLKALELMHCSDLLLLFLPGNFYKSVVMGKVFEYMRSGVEILAMIPAENETALLLKEFNYQNICPMDDIGKIEELLQSCFEKKQGRRDFTVKLEKYDRETQVQQLGLRMDKLL